MRWLTETSHCLRIVRHQFQCRVASKLARRLATEIGHELSVQIQHVRWDLRAQSSGQQAIGGLRVAVASGVQLEPTDNLVLAAAAARQLLPFSLPLSPRFRPSARLHVICGRELGGPRERAQLLVQTLEHSQPVERQIDCLSSRQPSSCSVARPAMQQARRGVCRRTRLHVGCRDGERAATIGEVAKAGGSVRANEQL